MELRQLQCFVAAAELENFTSASERLHMSQSALSRQIANLEGALGVLLFERTGQRVRLSPAGVRLRETAEGLVMGFQSLKAIARPDLADQDDLLTDLVAIAAPPSQGALLLPRLARSVGVIHPSLKLNFVDARATEAEASVERGEIDFALITHTEDRPELIVEPLFSEGWYIFQPPGLRTDLGPSCTVAAALESPLIAPAGGRERAFLDDLAAREGVTLNIVHDSNQHHLAITLSKNAQGCIFLPGSAVIEQKLEHMKGVSKVRDVVLTTAIVKSRSRVPSKSAAAVERMLRKDIAILLSRGVLQ